MNNQEALDKAYPLLIEQWARSGDAMGACFYRHPDCSYRCFVGFLIPDEDYDRSFESKGLDEVKRSVPCLADVCLAFLADGQNIHDTEDVEDWPRLYKALAEKYGLEWSHG